MSINLLLLCRFLLLLLLLLLLLPSALQPTVGFGLSNNILPFLPICHQHSPPSHCQHLKISFYFLFPSLPGSSPSSRPFQFLSEDLFCASYRSLNSVTERRGLSIMNLAYDLPKVHNTIGIKDWYWPQGLLSMPTDSSHKSWETPSDKTSVSSASKSDFRTSSIVNPGQCNFSCSREERMKASPWRLKTETFG